MRNKLKIFLLVSFILITQAAFADTRVPIKIIKITDGDTIEAKIANNKFKVRLIGIDCFETSKIHRAYKQAYLNNLSVEDVVLKGKFSKDYLEKLYKDRQSNNIYLDFKGIDIYGRALGIVYFDDLDVNQNLKDFGGCMFYNK